MKPVVKIVIVVAVCLLAGAAILAGKNHEPVVATVASADRNLPRLLDLGSQYCVPCQMMAGQLDTLSAEYAGVVNVEMIDVNDNPNAAQSYGITLIPTQIIFDENGNELFRHEGYMSWGEMAAKLIEFGYNSSSIQD